MSGRSLPLAVLIGHFLNGKMEGLQVFDGIRLVSHLAKPRSNEDDADQSFWL
jgi:hypothetical protein